MLLIFPVLLLGYLLLGLVISIGVARWSGRRFRSRLAPWAVFALLFALFFGDEIYGYWHWQHLCKTEGGLHVYKQVPVEGYMRGGLSESGAAEYLRPGYSYLEGNDYRDYGENKGRLYRYALDGNGQVNRTMIDKPQSRHIRSQEISVPYTPYVWANETVIRDRFTDEVLSANRSFGYKGATIVRIFRAMTGANYEGSASYCGEFNPKQLSETIPPIQRNNQ